MRQTSIDAYRKLTHKTTKREVVYSAIKKNPVTNKQLAKKLKKPINEITPRVNELVKMGLVSSIGTIKDPETNRRATLWSAT
jgi:predicted HTH transcriptional regulator